MRLHRRCKAACLGTCPDYLQFETGRADMLRSGTAALKHAVRHSSAAETAWPSRDTRRTTQNPKVATGGTPRHSCLSFPQIDEWSRNTPVRAENLDSDVLVMQPANQGVRHDASDLLNRA
jgi:hypothetical protein